VPIGAAVPSLVRWGLSCDADLVFRTIATFGPRSAPTLARELGVPLRRVDDALAELFTIAAATPMTNPRRTRQAPVWATRSPADVVAILHSRRIRQADPKVQAHTHHQTVRSLTDHSGLSSLLAEPGPIGGRLGEGVRYLPTRDAARERAAELIVVARQEQLVINTEQTFDADSARAAAALDRQILQHDIRVRIIGLPATHKDQHVTLPSPDDPGWGYREKTQVPLKLIMFDRRVAFFPADPDNFEHGYLEISQPGMVRALITIFEYHWANAVDPREHGMQEILLDDRERDLIRLLANGHTDISAAEQLRISARSVTNIMRGVMDRLGVDNRFQLGLALGAARVAQPSTLPATQPRSAIPTPEARSPDTKQPDRPGSAATSGRVQATSG
jgi:DNA-binding CsgD family transcriptional regulator